MPDLNWRPIDYEFEGWAERLESLWGQGFAHLEKIREPEKAGAYMAKAAGYLTKAQGRADQGVNKGNRYGISKTSRAPEWVQFGRFEAGIMGSLIKDTYDYFTHIYGHVFKERKELNEKLITSPKGSVARRKIGERLAKVRQKLNDLPAVASKYQITLKGWGALSEYTDWARNPNQVNDGVWLLGKDAGDVRDGDKRPDSVFIHGLKRSMDGFFARLKRRKWERETSEEGCWDSLVNYYGQVEPMSFNDGRDEYQNWGYV